MINIIIQTLKIMLWLGLVLGVLTIVNTICGTISNIDKGEKFSYKKMLKGIIKAAIFYISAVFTSLTFTVLPFINQMITITFGVELLSSELLNTLSSVAILGIIITSITAQGKKALENIIKMSLISSNIQDEEDRDE